RIGRGEQAPQRSEPSVLQSRDETLDFAQLAICSYLALKPSYSRRCRCHGLNVGPRNGLTQILFRLLHLAPQDEFRAALLKNLLDRGYSLLAGGLLAGDLRIEVWWL